MLEDFSHITHLRVTFADIDMLQHVNHIAHIRWAEEARVAYFMDIIKEHIRGTRGLILAKVEANYERQLDYHENIAIGCRVSRIGGKSLDFSYEIWSETHQQRAGFGTTPCVAFDYEKNASIMVPKEWRETIATYEKKQPA